MIYPRDDNSLLTIKQGIHAGFVLVLVLSLAVIVLNIMQGSL